MKTSDVVAAIAAAAKEAGIDECVPTVSVKPNATRSQWTSSITVTAGGAPRTWTAATRRDALRGAIVRLWNNARTDAKTYRREAREARAKAATLTRAARDLDRFARELTAALEVKP